MLEAQLEAKAVAFGPFQVDVRTGELRKHGYKIKLQDQPFRVLEILLQHPGELVTRDELQHQIWPADTFVDFDRGLNNAVKRLRDALGDSAEAPQFVETVARRGYRFMAPVRASLPDVPATPSTELAPLARPRNLRANLAWITAISVLIILVGALQFRRPGRQELKPVSEIRSLKAIASPVDNPIDYAAISPDGRNIAYTDGSGIHVRVLETGETRTIPPPSDDPQPSGSLAPVSEAAVRFPISWYPDGTRLLVTTGTPRSTATMWAISLVTGNAQKLHEGAWASAVSPDGATIAAIKNESEIWLMGPHGEEPHRFLSAEPGNEIGRVVWSPDSRRLLYFHVLEKPGRLECALENTSATDPHPVTILSDTRLCYSQNQSSWWFPDGRIIFPFAEPTFDFRDFNFWQIRVDAGNGKPLTSPERLTNWPGSCLQGITASADGKRAAFTRIWFHTNTTIGDIDPSRLGAMTHPHPLAADVDNDWPTAWTDDSRAVVFYSVKNGDTDIFEQPLDQESSRPLVVGPGEQLAAVLSPDGHSLIYMDVPHYRSFGLPNPVKLMKVSTSGGEPELILTSDAYSNHQCARAPSTVCIVSEEASDGRIVLSSFDPLGDATDPAGKRSKLLTLDPGTYWAVSPDGSTLATSKPDERDIQLRFISLGNAADLTMNVKGWPNLNSMHWAADGRSLFVSSRSANGCALLQVDLHGVAHVISQQPGAFQMWAIPSPDGRHLAVFSATVNSEVWMANSF